MYEFTLQLKRGTRARINALATRQVMKDGELFYITDDEVLAVATSAGTYIDASGSGAGLIDDLSISLSKTWSSSKLNSILGDIETALDTIIGSP